MELWREGKRRKEREGRQSEREGGEMEMEEWREGKRGGERGKIRKGGGYIYPDSMVHLLSAGCLGDCHCKMRAMSSVPSERKSETLPNPATFARGVSIPVASFPSCTHTNNQQEDQSFSCTM